MKPLGVGRGFVPRQFFEKLLLSKPRLGRHLIYAFAVHYMPIKHWLQYGNCQSTGPKGMQNVQQSARRLASSNMRSHSTVSQAQLEGRTHGNLRPGHSFVFHDTAKAGKAQTTPGIKSMTQHLGRHTSDGSNCNRRWALLLSQQDLRAVAVAFSGTRAVRHCQALYSYLLLCRFIL